MYFFLQVLQKKRPKLTLLRKIIIKYPLPSHFFKNMLCICGRWFLPVSGELSWFRGAVPLSQWADPSTSREPISASESQPSTNSFCADFSPGDPRTHSTAHARNRIKSSFYYHNLSPSVWGCLCASVCASAYRRGDDRSFLKVELGFASGYITQGFFQRSVRNPSVIFLCPWITCLTNGNQTD